MRVLLVSQYYWPEGFSINEVSNLLHNQGIEIEILTGKPNYPQGKIFSGYSAWGCRRETHLGVMINRVPLFARGRDSWRLFLNYFSFVFSAMIFAPFILRRKKFDVIFIYAPSPILQAIPAIFIGWLKGSSKVLWVQDLWPESLTATGYVKSKSILKIVKFVVSLIYRHVDLLLVQSESFVNPVRALSGGKIPVIYFPNSVSANFSVSSAKKIPVINGLDAKFSVVFAGNIGSAQSVEVIVESANHLRSIPEIQFIILGDGSRREWMVQRVKELNLSNLHLPGHLPEDTMPEILQKASALLVTLAGKEIFSLTIPNKLQAYLAAGRPILACLNGEGARLVTKAEAGFAIPAENSLSLAEAVLKLYNLSEPERKAMGARGREFYIKNFSQDVLIPQLIQHLRSSMKVEE